MWDVLISSSSAQSECVFVIAGGRVGAVAGEVDRLRRLDDKRTAHRALVAPWRPEAALHHAWLAVGDARAAPGFQGEGMNAQSDVISLILSINLNVSVCPWRCSTCGSTLLLATCPSQQTTPTNGRSGGRTLSRCWSITLLSLCYLMSCKNCSRLVSLMNSLNSPTDWRNAAVCNRFDSACDCHVCPVGGAV